MDGAGRSHRVWLLRPYIENMFQIALGLLLVIAGAVFAIRPSIIRAIHDRTNGVRLAARLKSGDEGLRRSYEWNARALQVITPAFFVLMGFLLIARGL
jgi:hypothetical protein